MSHPPGTQGTKSDGSLPVPLGGNNPTQVITTTVLSGTIINILLTLGKDRCKYNSNDTKTNCYYDKHLLVAGFKNGAEPGMPPLTVLRYTPV